MPCPECFSEHIVKNGRLGHGKPKFKCKRCGRQFVENPRKQRISDDTKALIDKLLLEKIPLAGIARVTGGAAYTRICEPEIQSHSSTGRGKKKEKGRLNDPM